MPISIAPGPGPDMIALTPPERSDEIPEPARTGVSERPITSEESRAAHDMLSRATLGTTPSATTPESSWVNTIKTKLIDLAESAIYSSHDLKVTSFKIGDRAGVGVRVKARVLAADDPLVAGDAHRAATSAKRAATGDPVTWAMTGGGIYPSAGFGASIPAGPATVTAGFSSNATIGYSVLAPYSHGPEAALEAAKALTVDLPFTAASAKELDPGTEVLLRGSGSVVAYTSVGAGKSLTALGGTVTIGASAGTEASISKALDVALRIKRLDADRVFVSLSNVDALGASGGVYAHAGVTSHAARTAVADLAGGVFKTATGLLAEKVDQQVEKWLSIDLRATHAYSNTETEIDSWVLDLSRPEAAKAYGDLLKLDARKADSLKADGPISGVRGAKLDERSFSNSDNLKLSFGPITLLSAVSSATETHGTLESASGTITYDRAHLHDGYSGIISDLFAGKRAVSRELVSVTRSGAPAPESYYHVRHTIRGDGVTTKGDIKRFLRMAEELDALDDTTKAVRADKNFAGGFGKTDRTIDVFITDAGLLKLAATPAPELHKAFAAAYERLDRPWDMNYLWGNDSVWKVTPWLNTASPDHASVMALLEKSAPTSTEDQQDDESDYRAITGRSLNQDRAAYHEAKSLVGLLEELAAAPTPAARVNVLAKAEHQLGLDFWRELATIARVAGEENVLVSDLSITDTKKKVEVVFKRDGSIQDPRAEIDRILADPP